MKKRDLLMKQIEREQKYCDAQNVGTEEYNNSFYRLSDLRKELADLEKAESDAEIKQKELDDAKHDRKVKNTLEGVRVVGCGIVLPLVGYVVVTAFEKDDSFTSALKGVVNCFIPKKMN